MLKTRGRIPQIAMTAAIVVTIFGCCLKRSAPRNDRGECPTDSALVGTLCVDKYEASVWRIDPTKATLVREVQHGEATASDLTGGAEQAQQSVPDAQGHVRCEGVQLDPSGFPLDGNWTVPFYAASVPGVYPTACINWFQAAQACTLSGKRLLTNQEWQIAAAGTHDPGINDGTKNTMCNTSVAGVGRTRKTGLAGSNPGGANACVSNWKVEDMVGNLAEYVGDWGDRADWNHEYFFKPPSPLGDGHDESNIGRGGVRCFGGCKRGGVCAKDADCHGGVCGDAPPNEGICGSPPGEPAAYQRGGFYDNGAASGVFNLIVGGSSPIWGGAPSYGFRCARELGH